MSKSMPSWIPLIFAIMLNAPACLAATPAEARLASKWAGSYTSHQELDDDYFHVTIDETNVNDNIITARGRATFFDDTEIINLQVEWVIDTESHFVEIWDSAVAGEGQNYDVEGSYQGSISPDLDTIFAIWRDRSRKFSGTLKLRAVEQFPDYSSKTRPRVQRTEGLQ